MGQLAGMVKDKDKDDVEAIVSNSNFKSESREGVPASHVENLAEFGVFGLEVNQVFLVIIVTQLGSASLAQVQVVCACQVSY